jgi:4a-hydroxytetrahydrobiopterin dehydratase
MKLTEDQIDAQLARVDGWKRDDEKWISKRYRFKAFMAGITFVNTVAEIAERMNHHPLISIDYKTVTLRLTSWHAGGLTEEDFDSAESYDRVYSVVGVADE